MEAGKSCKTNTQGAVPQRYVVCVLGCVGMAMNYILRINMNLAIVSMSTSPHASSNTSFHMEHNTSLNVEHNTSPHVEHNECHFRPENSSSEGAGYEGEFEWNELTQSLILGGLFWGYVVTQLPGGRLADLAGGRTVFGAAVAAAAVVSFLVPLAAGLGAGWLIAVRTLLGFMLGPCNSAFHALLSHWAPPAERSTLSTVIFAGGQVGTVFGYPLTALILERIGWRAVFYIEGCMALVWAGVWFWLVQDSPQQCRYISQRERRYIEDSLGQSKTVESPPVPWRKIAGSPPVWAIAVSIAGFNWGFYTLLTDLPLYIKEMLKADIKTNALLSSLPYVGMFSVSLAASSVCDLLARKGTFSIQRMRKVANAVAQIGPCICLVTITFFECNRQLVIALLFVGISLGGAICSGPNANMIEVAPNYAGTLSGLVGTIAVMPGFLAPITVGYLTNEQETLAQWRKVFYICAAIYLFDAVFYTVFGSTKEQSWNRGIDEESCEGKAFKKDQNIPTAEEPLSKDLLKDDL